MPSDRPPSDTADRRNDARLTPRQEAFADAYAETPNGAAAARAAGYARGSAKVAAARNLRRSGVVLRIMERRRQQAEAREARRAHIAEILAKALDFGLDQQNPHALARIASLLMRLDHLHATAPEDDRLLADATPEALHDLLACHEVAAGLADPEVPNPEEAPIEEMAERAQELMSQAFTRLRLQPPAGRTGPGRRRSGGGPPLPGAVTADRHLQGLMDHLRRGTEEAANAVALAQFVDDAAAAAARGEPAGAAAHDNQR